MGINFHRHFLTTDGENAGFEAVLRHIEHFLALGGEGTLPSAAILTVLRSTPRWLSGRGGALLQSFALFAAADARSHLLWECGALWSGTCERCTLNQRKAGGALLLLAPCFYLFLIFYSGLKVAHTVSELQEAKCGPT